MAIQTKVPAGQKIIAAGHALAVHIINRAEEEGQRLLQVRESRKDLLAKLVGLPRGDNNASFIEFRKVLDEKLSEIKATAESAGISLNAYTEANVIAATVRAETSLWVKMSKAVEASFKPDLAKPWAEISTAATAHLAQVANPSPTNPDGTPAPRAAGPNKRKAGKKPTPVLDKAKTFIKNNMLDEKGHVKADVNLAATVGMMLLTATVSQCEEVLAEVTRILEQKRKTEQEMREKAEKRSAKAKQMAKAAGVPTTPDKATAKLDALVKEKNAKAVPSSKAPA